MKKLPPSRQQLARQQQNYEEKPRQKICESCEHYRSTFVKTEWGGYEEKLRRCTLGGFAVKRKSSCAAHEFRSLCAQVDESVLI